VPFDHCDASFVARCSNAATLGVAKRIVPAVPKERCEVVGEILLSTPTIADWATFFGAELGAAASLAGLVIVAISINLARIVAFSHLPGRAIETLTMLVGVVLVSGLGLVPGQPPTLLGWEVTAVGLAMWLISVSIQIRTGGVSLPGKQWAPALRIILGQAMSLPFIVAGCIVVFWGPVGLYWVAPGIMFCLIGSVINAWVLLVEIVR
jgi:hypothetical protein